MIVKFPGPQHLEIAHDGHPLHHRFLIHIVLLLRLSRTVGCHPEPRTLQLYLRRHLTQVYRSYWNLFIIFLRIYRIYLLPVKPQSLATVLPADSRLGGLQRRFRTKPAGFFHGEGHLPRRTVLSAQCLLLLLKEIDA